MGSIPQPKVGSPSGRARSDYPGSPVVAALWRGKSFKNPQSQRGYIVVPASPRLAATHSALTSQFAMSKLNRNPSQIAMGSAKLKVPIWNFKFNLNRSQTVTGSKRQRT
jgi:hypothetical protein